MVLLKLPRARAVLGATQVQWLQHVRDYWQAHPFDDEGARAKGERCNIPARHLHAWSRKPAAFWDTRLGCDDRPPARPASASKCRRFKVADDGARQLQVIETGVLWRKRPAAAS